MLAIIVAADHGMVIGKQGSLPWRLRTDMKRFKALTWGHPVIMGRATAESIGKPLEGRVNIVLSRGRPALHEGFHLVSHVTYALQMAEQFGGNAFVIGGSQIYELFLPLADWLYWTKVHTRIEGGDRFFPHPGEGWNLVENKPYPADEQNQFPFTFTTYVRRTNKS